MLVPPHHRGGDVGHGPGGTSDDLGVDEERHGLSEASGHLAEASRHPRGEALDGAAGGGGVPPGRRWQRSRLGRGVEEPQSELEQGRPVEQDVARLQHQRHAVAGQAVQDPNVPEGPVGIEGRLEDAGHLSPELGVAARTGHRAAAEVVPDVEVVVVLPRHALGQRQRAHPLTKARCIDQGGLRPGGQFLEPEDPRRVTEGRGLEHGQSGDLEGHVRPLDPPQHRILSGQHVERHTAIVDPGRPRG